jgi:methionine-rich copper-binding protein CopC
MVQGFVRAIAFTVVAAVSTATLLAHMKATKMEPAADSTVTASPTRVQIWFTEAPDPKVSKLELSGPSGAVKLTGFQVTREKSVMATVESNLADGRYTARWQAAGNDGHIQKGEFAFTVKRTR